MIMIEKESTIAFSAIDKLVALFQNLEKAERKSDSALVAYYLKVKRRVMAYDQGFHTWGFNHISRVFSAFLGFWFFFTKDLGF